MTDRAQTWHDQPAEAALDSIRHLLAPRARVRRGGLRREVEATALVPGDIVFVSSGDRVLADLRLIEARGLRIDESALTGDPTEGALLTLCAQERTRPDRRTGRLATH